MNITLTVQSVGRRRNVNVKYRLAISRKDYGNYFSDAQNVTIFLNVEEITCSLPTEKCPELYHAKIDDWIKENNFHTYEVRHPTKLEFSFTILNGNITLTFER